MKDSKQSEVKHLKVGDAYSYSLTVTNPESEVEVHTGVYTIATQHRENRDSKSYWKITPDEEKRCFEVNYEWFWRGEEGSEEYPLQFMGILVENGELKLLGFNIDEDEVRVARFLYDTEGDSKLRTVWHGFPCCYWLNDQDIPHSHYLNKWAAMNIITESDKKKIIRGRRCRKL